MRLSPLGRVGVALALGAPLLGLGACGSQARPRPLPQKPVPADYRALSGPGYTLSVPGDYRTTSVQAPDGTMLTTTLPPSNSYVEIQTELNAHPRAHSAHAASVAQAVSDESQANRTTTAYRVQQRSVVAVQVPGAREAKLISERATNQYGPERQQELVLQARNGALLLLTVTVSDNAHGSVDPAVVIGSLRLGA